jgi:hypothetical protein
MVLGGAMFVPDGFIPKSKDCLVGVLLMHRSCQWLRGVVPIAGGVCVDGWGSSTVSWEEYKNPQTYWPED